MRRIVSLAALFSSLLLGATAPAAEFFFRDGDRVVMIGDSITEQHLYSNFIEMWVTTRFPQWNITFRNSGIGGDRSTGGNGRFQRDVVAHNATAMTVDFGMNDGGYKPFDEAGFKTYLGGLQGMADQAKKAGIRAAWCTPQPLDTGDQGPTALTAYNLTLEKYSEGVKQIAEKNDGVFVDQFHPYLAVLDKARGAGPKYDRITGGDAVHPGQAGQALMAASILQGLNFPTKVSSVEIDAANPSAAKAENCKVLDAAAAGDGIKFVRHDQSLPFFPEDAKSILKWSPILESLNDYGLKVTGLKPGKYAVKLDDAQVAEFTAEALAQGVNLAEAALTAGPVAAQVKAIRKAIEEKNRFHHDKIFRGITLVQLGNLPDWLGIELTPELVKQKRDAAFAERTAKLPDLDAAIRAACKIEPHTVTIAPVK